MLFKIISSFNDDLAYLFSHMPAKSDTQQYLDNIRSDKAKKNEKGKLKDIAAAFKNIYALVNRSDKKKVQGDPIQVWYERVLKSKEPHELFSDLAELFIGCEDKDMLVFLDQLCKRFANDFSIDAALRVAASKCLNRITLLYTSPLYDRRDKPRY